MAATIAYQPQVVNVTAVFCLSYDFIETMARTPKTPSEQRAQFSIGLPPDYERKKNTLLDRFGPVATRRYGQDKGFSGIVRLALDNLEVQPPSEDERDISLTPCASIHSLSLTDASKIILSAEKLWLVIPDPTVWLRIHHHDDALIARAAERKHISLILPHSTSLEGEVWFDDEVYHLLSECLEIYRPDHPDESSSREFLEIIGLDRERLQLHGISIITDDYCCLEVCASSLPIGHGVAFNKDGRGSAIYKRAFEAIAGYVIEAGQIDGLQHFYQSPWYRDQVRQHNAAHR